jgi:hypothetical protein
LRPGRRGRRRGVPRENGAACLCRARHASSNSSSSRSISLRSRSRPRRCRSASRSASSRSRRKRSFSRSRRSSSPISSSRDAARQLARTRSLCYDLIGSTRDNCSDRGVQMATRGLRPAKQIHELFVSESASTVYLFGCIMETTNAAATLTDQPFRLCFDGGAQRVFPTPVPALVQSLRLSREVAPASRFRLQMSSVREKRVGRLSRYLLPTNTSATPVHTRSTPIQRCGSTRSPRKNAPPSAPMT